MRFTRRVVWTTVRLNKTIMDSLKGGIDYFWLETRVYLLRLSFNSRFSLGPYQFSLFLPLLDLKTLILLPHLLFLLLLLVSYRDFHHRSICSPSISRRALKSTSFKVTHRFTFILILLSQLGFLEKKGAGLIEEIVVDWWLTLRTSNLSFVAICIHLFHLLTWSLIMEDIQTDAWNTTLDNLSSEVNRETLDTISIFARGGDLELAFTIMGPSNDWRVILPEEHKRICNKHYGCAILCHKHLFSLISLRLPFNYFEVGLFNLLLIAHSHLYSASWAYIKVF